MTTVLATYNIKGGVGKTSAAVNLAYLAARDGARTLLWDLDPQGACTYLMRIRPKVKGGARKLVRLKADAKTQARVDALAEKCNEGELTAKERAEYERYVTAGNLIAILQAQARLLLANKS